LSDKDPKDGDFAGSSWNIPLIKDFHRRASLKNGSILRHVSRPRRPSSRVRAINKRSTVAVISAVRAIGGIAGDCQLRARVSITARQLFFLLNAVFRVTNVARARSL